MFKEIADELKEFLVEIIDLPGYTHDKNLAVVTYLSLRYGMSKDVNQYSRMKFSKGGDIIFIAYKAKKDEDIVHSDIMFLHGKPVTLLIADHHMLYNEEPSLRLLALSGIVKLAIAAKKIEYLNLFYMKGSGLEVAFDHTIPLILMYAALGSFNQSEALRETIVSIVNINNECKWFNNKAYDLYFSLLENNTVEELLDNSVLATTGIPKEEEVKNETTGV